MERTKNNFQVVDAVNRSMIKNFTQVPNDLLRNPEISGKAKSLLCLLLSNKEGWKSCVATIEQMMKEGERAISAGLKELETHGYLLRVRYRNKKDKKWIGGVWCYTDTPWVFDIAEQLKTLEGENCEALINKAYYPQLRFAGVHYADVGFADVQNSGLIILYYNNTKCNNTNSLLSEENFPGVETNNTPIKKNNGKPSTKERNKKYLPLAKKLSRIIQQNKSITPTTYQLMQWSSEIRKLCEQNKTSMKEINKVLDWYKGNIGGEYIPVVESGYSLRMKFQKLQNAIVREKGFKKEYDKDYEDSINRPLDDKFVNMMN